MFDYHMHTTVSYDGKSDPKEMVEAAAAAGLKEICFTDHLDYTHAMPREETCFRPEDYRNAYAGLQAPGLLIRQGVEVGLTTWNAGQIREDIARFPYDFVLGSVHFIEDTDPYFPEFWDGKTVLQAEQLYFREVYRCVECQDDFDVLGHLTYIGKLSANPAHRVPLLAEHREIIAEIMKKLIEKGKGIEINTSGRDRCGDFLPGADYLRLYKDLGGSIVTVGSDAHKTDRVGQYTCLACRLAGEIFGHVCTFQNRRPIFHKL